jgi:sec-independent protein translocase protein TatC
VATNRSALQRFSHRVRRQLLWIFVSFGIGFFLALYYRAEVFTFILAPAQGRLSPDGLPIFTAPTEMFFSTFRLAITVGLVAAFPMTAVGVSRLLIPLLLPSERKFIFAFFVPALALCFLAGTTFSYYVLLPTGLGFLLGFGTDIASPVIRISEYMSLATALIFWLGLVFELPLAMYTLTRLRLVEYRRFKSVRKYVPPTSVIFGAILAPGFDGVSALLIAVPLWVLYEVGLVLSWLGRPGTRRRWSPLRLAFIEAVLLSLLVSAVVGTLWYAGVLGGNG